MMIRENEQGDVLMRIKCQKSELQRSVNIVSKAVAVKSPVYILEGILLSTEENSLVLYGSDDTLSIKNAAKANIIEEGRLVLPAKLLSEILAKFADCELTMYTQDNNVVMECGHSKTTLCYMDADNYPDFTEYDTTNAIKIYSKDMVSMIDQTVFATSVSEDKPILTGILVEIEEKSTRMVALDGYRLAIREEAIESQVGHKEVIVPSKSMREAARILPADDTDVKLFFGDRMMSIICGDTQINTRVLQGDYIKYKNIIPDNFQTRFIVDRLELYNSLDRASILARQTKTNVVNMNIEGEVLTITSNSEVGKAREELPISITGKNLDISFNSRYLLDVLKAVEDDEIVFDLNTAISPCVIRPVSGGSYLYMVLPVKTNNAI